MRRDTFQYPKSSFLGMPKDTAIIMEKILENKNILRLLYYNTPDCIVPCDNIDQKYPLTGAQIKQLLTGVPDLDDPDDEKKKSDPQISNVPKLDISRTRLSLSYLRVTFDSFTPSVNNNFYRDHIVEFKVMCHFDHWTLKDYELRPFRIAGELDWMFDKARLTGIGVLNFIGADTDIYDNEYGGVTLRYLADRGHEDDYKDDYTEAPMSIL